jgi:hypothetical protein
LISSQFVVDEWFYPIFFIRIKPQISAEENNKSLQREGSRHPRPELLVGGYLLLFNRNRMMHSDIIVQFKPAVQGCCVPRASNMQTEVITKVLNVTSEHQAI